MNNPPDGIVTFLFTDIEGSIKLAQQFPDTLPLALKRHHEILDKSIETHNGYVFEIIGDAFCAAFNSPLDAINSACEIQKNIKTEKWGEAIIKIRIGINTGEAKFNGKGYTGYMALSRTQRVMSVAYGEQILISQITYDHIRDLNTKDISFIDMGERRLKDLVRSEHIYQAAADYLQRDFPPLETIDTQPNNLPIQVTSFIGREKEISDVKALLLKTPILSLLGSGGTGKTRISIQIGAEMIDNFVNGVWFIELSTLSDSSLVVQEIASAFNLRESGNRKIIDILLDYLKDKELLLIIDTCEHLIVECARVIDMLIRKSSKLKILTTSREALRISGETVYRVPSLKVPEIKLKHTVESISEFESVRLFIDRASTAKSDFSVTTANASFIAQICNNLDGIPFALELAAARVCSLSVDKIAERLDDRFRLLTGGSRTALPKQQTLHAMIDWSYDLLNEQEKALLARMSVFAGGCTLESGEEVCSGNGIEDFEVLDLMSSLVDKSLISFVEENGRYGQLETVRQYGSEKLTESREEREYRMKHFIHFYSLAEEAEPQLSGQGQVKWLNRIENEHNNLRVAVGWSMESNELEEKGLRFVTDLKQFWLIRGYYSEGKRFIINMIKKGNIETKLKGEALSVAGKLSVSMGDYKEAKLMFEEALTIFREVRDDKSIADSFTNLASIAFYLGKFDEAQIQLEQAITIYRKIDNKRCIADSLNHLGLISSYRGDIDKARKNFEDSIIISNEIGYKLGVANSLNNLGQLAGNQGEYTEAKKCFEESINIFREIRYKLGVANSLNNLGAVELDQREYTEASIYFEEALTIYREIADKRGISNSLGNLGWIAYNIKQYQESQEYFENAISIYLELGDKSDIARCLEGIGNLNLIKGLLHAATKLYGSCQILRETVGNPIYPNEKELYDKTITDLRSQLGDEEFEKAWNEGRSMTLEQAVEMVLKK